MLWRIIIGFVALLVVAKAQSHRDLSHPSWEPHRGSRDPWKNLSDNLIDIDVETERDSAMDQAWEDAEELSGSGSGMTLTDDEDLLGSGSGSGDDDITDDSDYIRVTTHGPTPTPRPTPAPATPTVRQKTPCEQLREASPHLSSNYVPVCTIQGDFDILQCHGRPKSGSCWCADLQGKKIPGTSLEDDIPDCFRGKNLPRCVHQLVIQMRQINMLGAFRPMCTVNGKFESTQCHGSMCFCVDPESGEKRDSTAVFQPDRPDCDGDKSDEEDDKPEHRITVSGSTSKPGVTTTKEININLGGGDKEDDDSSREVSNETGDDREPMKEPSSAASMISQPGILAAIIGGSVVLLLCAVLLAMFIIYRMKKKDEGSYPLDEPRKLPNYAYQRAPEKEFYA